MPDEPTTESATEAATEPAGATRFDGADLGRAQFEATNLSGARFEASDLSHAVFRDCDLRGVRIVDSWLTDIEISGLLGRTVVNDVDVTAVIEAELDRRAPERVPAREAETADELRAAWQQIQDSWQATMERARRLPQSAWYERVNGEWSLLETLRHLVFVVDAWLSRPVLDEPAPFHHLGLTHSSHPPEAAAALGIDLAARPTLDEVVAVVTDRSALMDRVLDGLTDADTGRLCLRSPAPGYPEEPRTVRACIGVVLREHAEHLRYARRDLAELEAGRAG